MSDVIKYPLSAAIDLCEQLDNDETNYHLKMLEYKRERDEARDRAAKLAAQLLTEMKARPTPETDALDCELHNPRVLSDRYSEMMEHAQKLERERDEAREEAKRLDGAYEDATNYYARIIELTDERDEARRKLNNLDVTAIHSCHNECQKPICVLRRERDEAREEIKRLKVILDLIKKDLS
jgi:uncharacterized coiled-coil DUF342 family protein